MDRLRQIGSWRQIWRSTLIAHLLLGLTVSLFVMTRAEISSAQTNQAQTDNSKTDMAQSKRKIKLPPCRYVKVLVAAGAGSGTDLIMRSLVRSANAARPKPLFRVVNREGKDVWTETATSAPNGCTLLTVNQDLVAAYLLGARDLDWESFRPLALLVRVAAVLAGKSTLEAENLKDLLTSARETPGSVSVGYSDSRLERIFLATLETNAKVSFDRKAFETGVDMFTALLEKRVDLGFISVPAARRRIQDGKLKAFGVSTAERIASLSDVPTLAEQGGFSFGYDLGLIVAKGTPVELVDHLAAIFEKAVEDKLLVDELGENGIMIHFLASDPYTRYLEDLRADWRKLLGTEDSDKKPGDKLPPVKGQKS